MSQSEAAGSIYDLGYRRYDGARLGRRHAVQALFLYSLRSAFGLGRRTGSKIIPIGLTIVVFIPAAIQLGIASVARSELEILEPQSYYGYVQTILALFCAAVAPEMAARDQRHHTLSLYFSRAMRRSDYALAKTLGLAAAMLILTLGPQMLLFVGNSLAGDSIGDYARDNKSDILPIIVSAVLLSGMLATIGMAIASQTPRRAYSTIAILVIFVVGFAAAGILVEVGSQTVGRVAVLCSPIDVARGMTLWLFDEPPESGSPLDRVNFDGWVFGLAALVHMGIASALIWRRYDRIAA